MTGRSENEESAGLDSHALSYIRHAAERGLYEIRGMGAKRRLPSFDDLVFLTASMSRAIIRFSLAVRVRPRETGRKESTCRQTAPRVPLSW